MQKKKVVLIVLDACGCGDAPDAAQFSDEGANTLGHVRERTGVALPHLTAMGLGNIPGTGFPPAAHPTAAHGRLTERSLGKDTTVGHWELTGLVTETPLPTYPDGFPKELLQAIEEDIGVPFIGNCVGSGTAIIDSLGEEHVLTGRPIAYTSADSVFQIAAHESIIPLSRQYEIAEIARRHLTGIHGVGRVIARPFVGEVGAFQRTGNRRDVSLIPPTNTLLDGLKNAGKDVVAIGKIEDIYASRGITRSNHAAGNAACIAATLGVLTEPLDGLVFVNLVDTDMLYGHRNDPHGFAGALAAFDDALPALCACLSGDDMLLITADHGCDPTMPGTDHTRERVPLLVFGKGIVPENLGTRDGFADVSATILDAFGMENTLQGTSFYTEITRRASP